MANPLVDQGRLNRLRGSVIIPNFPQLNVTAAFLGKEGISLALQGEISLGIPTMTGVVQSPEPYQMAEVGIHLLKSQSLSSSYKDQIETLALLGPITVRTDASTLSDYFFDNVAIASIDPLKFNGEDAGFGIMLRGQYYINSAFWNPS